MKSVKSYRIESWDDIHSAVQMTADVAKKIGFGQEDIVYLQLVTEEACTNAYEHSSYRKEEPFQIKWCVLEQSFEIVLKQKGEPYSIEFSDEVNYGTGGRGLQLIVSLMDEVRVEQKGKYVFLNMKKAIKQA